MPESCLCSSWVRQYSGRIGYLVSHAHIISLQSRCSENSSVTDSQSCTCTFAASEPLITPPCSAFCCLSSWLSASKMISFAVSSILPPVQQQKTLLSLVTRVLSSVCAAGKHRPDLQGSVMMASYCYCHLCAITMQAAFPVTSCTQDWWVLPLMIKLRDCLCN